MSINLGSMLGIQPVNTQPAGAAPAGAQLPAFADYSAGDTFQAEVTGVKGEMVTMTTPQGAEFETEFPKGLSVNPGDIVDMALVSKDAGGVNLKPVAINGQPIQLESTVLQSYLMDNGIAPSRLNEGAAQVLMNYNIAPTPKIVSQLVQVAMALPEVPTSVAVTMAQNEIPPTPANAQALQQLTVQPPVLGQDIASLSGMVEKGADGQIFSQVFPQVAAEIASPEQMQTMEQGGLKQLAGQLGAQIQQQGLENMTPRQIRSAVHQFVQQLPVAPEQRPALEQVLVQAFNQTSEAVQNQGQMQQSTAAAPEAPVAEQAPVGQAAAVPEEQTAAAREPAGGTQGAPQTQQMQQTQQQAPAGQMQQTAPQPDSALPQNGAAPAAAAGPAAAETDIQAQPQGQPAVPEQPADQNQQPVRNDLPQPEQQVSARQSQAAAPASEPQIRQERSAAAPQEQPAAKELDQAAGRKEPVERETPARMAENLVQENPIRHEANRIMSNLGKMVVKVRDGAVQEDAKALQDGVREQQHLSSLTKESVSRLFGSGSAIAQKATEMSNQVRVSGQLDQFYYAQVPFQTQQMEGTADLYVFQRQGQKAERERTHITVLIGLDTPHMGRVESVLRSQEGRLSVEFRVSSKRVQTFFEEAVSGFREEMSSIGFPLESVRVSQIGEKVTPLNAMQVMEPKKEIRLRGLDIEA